MLEGKDVFLQQDPNNYKNKDGILLGYIFLQEEENLLSFNQLLIESGYARAYLVSPFQYSINYKKAQDEAKKNKI